MKNGVLSFLIYIVLIVPIVSCNPRMPEEEKNAIKEELEARKIKRVTPREIMASANEKGRIITQYLMDLQIDPSVISNDFIDSLNTLYEVKAKYISISGDEMNRDGLEKQIIDTFMFAETDNLDSLDHITQLENMDLLYSKPVINDSAGVSFI
ncbi:MAG: hypothetical protein OEY34_01490, partial [Cyclobacteriaceae bacterium]|nr:hypothetical protein [Cyclobacteriaceae bacterium]